MQSHDTMSLKSPYYVLGFTHSALRTVLTSLENETDRYLCIRRLNLRTLSDALEAIELHFEAMGEEAPQTEEEAYEDQRYSLEPRSCDNGDGLGHTVREWR